MFRPTAERKLRRVPPWRRLSVGTISAVLLAAACVLAFAQSSHAQLLDLAKESFKRAALSLEAQRLDAQGHQHRDAFRLAEAAEAFRRAIAVYEHLYPKEGKPNAAPDYAQTLNDLGLVLYEQGSFAEAKQFAQRAVAMCRALYPPEQYQSGHNDLAAALHNLGLIHDGQGDYRAARKLLEEAVAMRRRLYPAAKFPDGHERLAHSLAQLGLVCRTQGDMPAALDYMTQALAMRRRLFPPARYPQGHTDIASSLRALGEYHVVQGDYLAAQAHVEQALEMYRRLAAEDHDPVRLFELAITINALGYLLDKQGQYAAAQKKCEEALDLLGRALPPESAPRGHPFIVSTMNILLTVHLAQGDYARARSYAERALEMNRRLYPTAEFPRGHPYLAVSLNNLAAAVAAQGDGLAARKLYEQALHMLQGQFPDDAYPRGRPEIVAALNNVAHVLNDQGELTASVGYYERAHAMQQALYPAAEFESGHPELIISGLNLAKALIDVGRVKEGQSQLESALRIARHFFQNSQSSGTHPHVTVAMNLAAVELRSRGRFDEARAVWQETLAIQLRQYPEADYPQGHPWLALTLFNLGELETAAGNYEAAHKHLDRALAMVSVMHLREPIAEHENKLVPILTAQGHLAVAQREYPQARLFFSRALAIQERNVENFVAAASEAESLNLLANLGDLLSPQISLAAIASGEAQAADELYAWVWARRGAVQRAVAARQQLMSALTNHEHKALYARYLETRRNLAHLAVAASDPDPKRTASRQGRLQELTALKEQQERDLAEQVPQFAQQRAAGRRSHRALIHKLPAHTAVVDLVRYVRHQRDPEVRGQAGLRRTLSYAAFVLAPKQPVRFVDLGPAGPIDQAVANWRQEVQRRDSSLAAGAELRRLVWDPMEAALAPAADQGSANKSPATRVTPTIYICPDGLLTGVAWAALPRGKDQVLAEDYEFAVLPHAQLLLQQLEGPAGRPTARGEGPGGVMLLVGDVSYDAQPPQAPETTASLPAGALFPTPPRLLATRGESTLAWQPLPGTKAEIDAIQSLRPLAPPDLEFRLLQGAAAAPSRFLAALPDAQLVHLATHGFFADPRFRSLFQAQEHAAGLVSLNRAALGERTTVAGRNPLTLSGLVLAGANLPPAVDEFGIPTGDGGVLTAEAISGLSVPQVQMVVLSACETGLGEVAGGEGVFGLQRAFHTAGARNIIASLWKVDDNATQTLMQLFYTNLWKHRLPPLKALRQAHRTMLVGYEPKEGKFRAGFDLEPVDEQALERALYQARQQAANGQVLLPAFYWAGFVLSGSGN